MNEIVGAWLSCAREVLQYLEFGNPVFLNDVVYFTARTLSMWLVFCFLVSKFVCNNDDVFVIFFLGVLFIFLFVIMEVVSPPSKLIIYSSDMSFDGVLVPLELLLCGVSSGPSATKSWPSIDQENPLIVGFCWKEPYMYSISVCRSILPFYQIILMDPFLLKGFVSYNTRFLMFDIFVSL